MVKLTLYLEMHQKSNDNVLQIANSYTRVPSDKPRMSDDENSDEK